MGKVIRFFYNVDRIFYKFFISKCAGTFSFNSRIEAELYFGWRSMNGYNHYAPVPLVESLRYL